MIAAAARNAVRLDGDVAKLSGHAIHAVEDFAIQDDGAADAGAEREHRKIVNATARAQPLFAESGDIGVVIEEDSRAQAALDFVAYGIIGPSGKVGGLAHHSRFPVDDAGNANTGADEASAAAILFGEAMDGVAHFADDVVAAKGNFDAKSNFFQKLAVCADGRDAQVGAAEIDSDGKIRHGQKGIRTAARHC